MLGAATLSNSAILVVARDNVTYGFIGFDRREWGGDIGDTEVAGLRLLAPHIRRAVMISEIFDMQTVIGRSFEAVVDKLACGIVLTDGELGVVHANSTATRMLQAGEPIRQETGKLTLSGRDAQAALERAVRAAASGGEALGHKGIGIPAGGEHEAPSVVHVLPLTQGSNRGTSIARATVALFVAPSGAGPRLPLDALALIYDLTPAEVRVLDLLVGGASQTEIATRVGIAPSTVKTHVLHLFHKTGCKRQADLVKLATSLSAPV